MARITSDVLWERRTNKRFPVGSPRYMRGDLRFIAYRLYRREVEDPYKPKYGKPKMDALVQRRHERRRGRSDMAKAVQLTHFRASVLAYRAKDQSACASEPRVRYTSVVVALLWLKKNGLLSKRGKVTHLGLASLDAKYGGRSAWW